MSRVTVPLLAGITLVCQLVALPLQAADEELMAQVRSVLQLGTKGGVSSSELAREASRRNRELAKPRDPRLDYALGLVLAKLGKHAEAEGTLRQAIERLDGGLQIAAEAALAHSLIDRQHYSAGAEVLQSMAEHVTAEKDALAGALAEEVAILSAQLIAYLEGPMSEISVPALPLTRRTLATNLPPDAREVFERTLQEVTDQYDELRVKLDMTRDQIKEELAEERTEKLEAIEEAKDDLKDEQRDLAERTDRERERINSAKGQLQNELRAAELRLADFDQRIGRLGRQLDLLISQRPLYFQRRTDKDGRVYEDVINVPALLRLDREIDQLTIDINHLRQQRDIVRANANRTLAAGNAVVQHEQGVAAAVDRKQSQIEKDANRLKKRQSAVQKNLRNREETSKTNAIRTKMRDLDTYAQLPFVAQGRRILAAVEPAAAK